MTVPQLVCLQIVIEHDGLCAGELSRHAELSQSTCVGIVDRLESKGLLIRTRSNGDRRKVHLHATDKGHVMYDQIPPLLQERLTEGLSALPNDEQETIAAALERVVAMLQITHVDAAPVLDTVSQLGRGRDSTLLSETEPEEQAH